MAAVVVATAGLAMARPGDRGAASGLKRALDLARAEAAAWRKSGKIPAEEPRLLAAHPGLSAEQVLQVVTRRQDADPFIDAAVRWQFAALEFDPTGLDDRAFEQLLQHAPPLLANPRAESKIVDEFAHAERKAGLSRGELQRLDRAADLLDDLADKAESMNRPALAWRQIMEGRFQKQASRVAHLRLERAAAIIKAGWPSRDAKMAVGKAFKALALDADVTDSDRRALEKHAQQLIGLHRRIVNQVTFSAGGRVSVTFTNAMIDQEDVTKWVGQMAGKDNP